MKEETALLKKLLEKKFYDNHKDFKCPHTIFSKKSGKIKTFIDEAMRKYNRDLSVDEIQTWFFINSVGLTSSQKQEYADIFGQIKEQEVLSTDLAEDVLSKLFQRGLGKQIANIAFGYVNGRLDSLQPLRSLLDTHNDNFLPDISVDWEDLDVESVLLKYNAEEKWKFNLPTLAQRVRGISDGHLIVCGARPNTGKTSFHASLVAAPNGFAAQGAKCIIMCNEESKSRVATRYITAGTGIPMDQIYADPDTKAEAIARWKKIRKNIGILDATGYSMQWVESVCKTYKPDVIVMDIGDKFTSDQSHEGLKMCAIHARQIAKEYDCAIFYMSQLSAEAEGRVNPNQSMMEGSKTGKASEADLMLLIAKNPPVEGVEDDGFTRHITVAKNKLTGWHGRITCNLNYVIGRYEV